MSIASFKTILRNTVYYEMKKKIVKNSLNCNFLTDFHTFKIQSQYNFNELSVFGQKKKKGFFQSSQLCHTGNIFCIFASS